MCYNVSKKTNEQKLISRYNRRIKLDQEIQPELFLNGFGRPVMPLILQEEPEFINTGKWGLLPSFIKTETEAGEFVMNTLNAKCETIFEKASFKKNILRQRCLVPVTGFFEWRDISKKKYPYLVGLRGEDIFSLGGIYNPWLDHETGEVIITFSIITTPANPLMAKIHNLKQRMPLIFTRDQEELWLKNDLDAAQVKALMQPLDETHMHAHTIRKFSPRAGRFDESLLEETEYPELAFYD